MDKVASRLIKQKNPFSPRFFYASPSEKSREKGRRKGKGKEGLFA